MEGTVTLKLDDGREISELFFGPDHLRRIADAWASGECAGTYQAASGDHCACARPLGHSERCEHRARWDE